MNANRKTPVNEKGMPVDTHSSAITSQATTTSKLVADPLTCTIAKITKFVNSA